jgi:glycosyltransferase involved in cell wall biosynthesis
MPALSMVMPYYRNPGMLAHQYEVWAAYPEAQTADIEIVLVDDGSPDPAVDVARPAGLPALRIYRVLIDRPWNQHGARNLGVLMATAPRLFLTDMDHVLTAESLAALLNADDPAVVHTFPRLDAPGLTPTLGRDGRPKPHPNTFAMARDTYWRAGGYDCRLCGIYGTDSEFRRRLGGVVPLRELPGCPIVRYPREVIRDASTTTLARKEGRGDTKQRVLDRIRREGSEADIVTINFPWERVL